MQKVKLVLGISWHDRSYAENHIINFANGVRSLGYKSWELKQKWPTKPPLKK